MTWQLLPLSIQEQDSLHGQLHLRPKPATGKSWNPRLESQNGRDLYSQAAPAPARGRDTSQQPRWLSSAAQQEPAGQTPAFQMTLLFLQLWHNPSTAAGNQNTFFSVIYHLFHMADSVHFKSKLPGQAH